MSPQEMQALQDFLNQLTQVRGVGKDPQADAMIAAAVARQPDASYLLVQRALLMEQALNSAKAQIASLQGQLQDLQAGAAAAPARGFFDNNAWGNTAPAAAPVRPAYAPAPAPMAAAMPYQAAPASVPASGFFGGALGSTLGTVAATAAGVAGGAFLFQGIEHLFNGSGSGAGLMHQNGLSGLGGMNDSGVPMSNSENTTVNNYYGAAGGQDSTASDAFSDINNIDFADGNGDDSII